MKYRCIEPFDSLSIMHRVLLIIYNVNVDCACVILLVNEYLSSKLVKAKPRFYGIENVVTSNTANGE